MMNAFGPFGNNTEEIVRMMKESVRKFCCRLTWLLCMKSGKIKWQRTANENAAGVRRI